MAAHIELKATTIYSYGDPVMGRLTLPKKTDGDDLDIGDFVIWDTSGVEAMSATNEDTEFIGICGTDSADADGPQDILVYLKCIVEAPCESATYTLGECVSYNSTTGKLETHASPADGICWVIKHYGSATTSLKVMVDTVNLAKQFAVL
jgi:hypothetical protein